MNRILKFVLLAAALLPVTAMLLGSQRPQTVQAARVGRGKYLTEFGGCSDCHTPMKMTDKGPVPDPARYLAGHPHETKLPAPPEVGGSPWFAATAGMTAWAGPWGVSFASNLTPDQNTGLGIWSEAMFLKAMKTGKHMGYGRDLLPPMPWQSVSKLSDDDLKAIFAYLRTIPAVRNRVPDPLPAGAVATYE